MQKLFSLYAFHHILALLAIVGGGIVGNLKKTAFKWL